MVQATNKISLKPGFSSAGQQFSASIGCDGSATYAGGAGFVQRSTANYEYDKNGNLTKDPNKQINVTYNHLNLPTKVVSYQDATAKTIRWTYDATGKKLSKILSVGGTIIGGKAYLDGVEYSYEGGGLELEAVYFSDGRAVPTDNGYQYEYNLTDHLGNVRVVFSDTNNDGTPEILQENAYYPFGMDIEELSHSGQQPENKYLYNGKELNNDFGLGWYDYQNRWLDPATGRFTTVDKLADDAMQLNKSPYAYAWNNPINLTDPDGNCPRCFKALIKTAIKSVAKGKVDLGEVYDAIDAGRAILSPSSTLLERAEGVFNLASPVSTKELKAVGNFVEGVGDAKKVGKAGDKVDYIGFPDGTTVHKSQSKMEKSLKGAGFEGKDLKRADGTVKGREYELDNVNARAMEPDGTNPRRTSFENKKGQPSQPGGSQVKTHDTKGMTKSERKEAVRQRTHAIQNQ